MDDFLMTLFSEQKQMEAIKKTNDYTCRFGLTLTDGDIKELILRRKECLAEQQRVEFGSGILEKLIFAFCDSDFIEQENYAETVTELQNIFYMYKNESMDELTDDELIKMMREAFDGECHGSLQYLEETYLDEFARTIRANTRKFIGRYTRSDD